LFEYWRLFADERGEWVGTNGALLTALEQKGFRNQKTRDGKLIFGLRLAKNKAPKDQDAPTGEGGSF
jgi:hypothetical protein